MALSCRAAEIFHHCFDHGAMVRYSGDMIALGPALIISETQIAQLVDLVRQAIRAVP